MGEEAWMVWSTLLGIPAFVGALFLVFIGAGFLRVRLDRYAARPHALEKATARELTAIRKRLDELEGKGSEVHELTERVGFLERLLEGGGERGD